MVRPHRAAFGLIVRHPIADHLVQMTVQDLLIVEWECVDDAGFQRGLRAAEHPGVPAGRSGLQYVLLVLTSIGTAPPARPERHLPLWPEVILMFELLGQTKLPWREGFRRMILARHSEIRLKDRT